MTGAADAPAGQSIPSTPMRAPTGELATCYATVDAAEEVLGAARAGIDHWRRHVKASADWAAGRISLDRKRAIWKSTRLAGPGDLRRYETVLASYAATGAGCDGVPETDECAERVAALVVSMDAAAGAMDDWEWHQEQMAMFAEGRFGAAHANATWEVAKRKAPDNLGRFANAEAALAKAPECG